MKKKSYNCPAEMTVSLIGGKWKLIILYNLRKGAVRFGQLKRQCPGITAATLATQLKEMEADGLVEREAGRDGKVPMVEYRLSERGESLRPIMNAMIRWGNAHREIYVQGRFRMEDFALKR